MMISAAMMIALSGVIYPTDTECVRHFMWTGQPRGLALHLCHGVPLPDGFYTAAEELKQEKIRQLQKKE